VTSSVLIAMKLQAMRDATERTLQAVTRQRASGAPPGPRSQGVGVRASSSISIRNSGSARPFTSTQVPVGNCFV
jgi:hypothetical protein